MASSSYRMPDILLSVAAYCLPMGQTVEIECTPCYLKGHSHHIWVGRCAKCSDILASCDDSECFYNIECRCLISKARESE
jgi:hypothetical protein